MKCICSAMLRDYAVNYKYSAIVQGSVSGA